MSSNSVSRLRLFRRGGLESVGPWLIAAIAASGLYFGRTVLIPIIMAVLLSFLLTPVVAGLRRARLPRSVAVLLAVILALAGVVTTSVIIVSQASTLSKDATLYAERITGKVTNFQIDMHQRFGFLLNESTAGGSGHRNAKIARDDSASVLGASTPTDKIPVEVHQPPATPLEEVSAYVMPALAPIETALVVLIVTIFILFQKEDLRDRLIRLMGASDLHRTTVALDEGAKRLSQYFLSQFIVNCGFGAVIWAGLFLLGVPSPGLWGILSGLLRFIPYVGPLIAALGPVTLAAAIDPGWHMVLSVVLLFLIVEPLVGYVIEPLLYGHSTGLSPVSVVVAALFWTWIWGPLGLVLSMPVTLMLVVLGRHFPAFEVFDILFGDRPALSPAEAFYQRALAGHPEEAIDHAEELLGTLTLASYYDEVVLGGLRLAAADVDRGAVERAALRSVCETTMEVLDALRDHQDALVPIATLAPIDPVLGQSSGHNVCRELNGYKVMCVAGRGPLDAAVLEMMVQLLRRAGCDVRSQSRDALRRDDDVKAQTLDADIICILGLFDDRAFRRILPYVEQRKDTTVLIGVQRSEGVAPTESSRGLLPSMSAICGALRTTDGSTS